MKYLHTTTLEIFIWLLFQKECKESLWQANFESVADGYIYKPAQNLGIDFKNYEDKNIEQFFKHNGKYTYPETRAYNIRLVEEKKEYLLNFLKEYIEEFKHDRLKRTSANYCYFEKQLKHLSYILTELYEDCKGLFTLNIDYKEYKNVSAADFRKIRILELILFLHFHEDNFLKIRDCSIAYDNTGDAIVDIEVELIKTPEKIFKQILPRTETVILKKSGIAQSQNIEITLTDKELKVIQLAAKGVTNYAIGWETNYSKKNVETILANIYEKLKINHIPGQTKKGIAIGILANAGILDIHGD